VERSDAESLRSLLGTSATDLARLVPAVSERLPEIGAAPALDPAPARFRLFDGVTTFLRRLTAEDVHVLVTRAITSALRRIAAEHPALGEHLAATVRTGTFCSYVLDPRSPIRWDV
jgi:hypothetical protein